MFDVAIIGCGPVGALAANFFGKAGLKTLVVEKAAKPFPLPRAVHLDHEMMRLFQAANVINRIKGDMRDARGHIHIGADNGVIRYMGTEGKERSFGWSNDYFFFQPELEDHLRDGLAAYPNVDLRLGTEFISSEQIAEKNGNTICLQFNSDAGPSSETARWVIACDGAHSAVRKSIGIKLDDLKFEEPWLVVDAEVEGPVRFPDLTGVPKQADLQHMSVMMCDPKRPATIVPGRGNHRRWEMMLLPGEDDVEMMRPEKVQALLEPWLKDVPHKIIRAATYRFHGLIAEQWRQGNIFLAGDAAHQTPPFFGQGMCHGLRDVANLAWKMIMIKHGSADETILDTYQTERDPHVREIIKAAVEAGRYICILDPEKAAARDIELREKNQRSTETTTAAELIPAINNGIVFSASVCAGERFIQPKLKTETGTVLLDDVVRGCWKLFVSDAHVGANANKIITHILPKLDISITDASLLNDDKAITNWLLKNNINAVLVRPDFYIFGTSQKDVTELLQHLAKNLGNNNQDNLSEDIEKTA